MSEKTNPELNTEETAASVSEDTETTVLTDNDEAVAAESNEAIVPDDTENTVSADTTAGEATADTAANEETTDITATEEEQPKKKKTGLQKPIIIACCIVLVAILGFLGYMAFFLKEPENLTWSNDVNDVTYYYEFKSDGTFTGYLGSIEMNGSFQKTNDENGKTITLDKSFGSFYQGAPATYSIKGSRLFGNQEMSCSYSEEYEFTLKQSKREKKLLDLPENFTADESLVGSWIFKYMNYDIYKVTFNKDGSMVLEFLQDGVKYNGIYTIEGSTINFTYYVTDSTVVPIDYAVDGDYLTFMGYQFVREGSEAEKAATSDQANMIPQANDQAQETQAAEAVTEAAEAKEAAE
ncbi:DUF5640 domain-containing protein [Ruminococcus sp.]|uniref:DUF5640 domain-containing protein n=1 Tax=Ruminococcus sp. TaxID=41978 RepID=UPI002E805C1E|nr:DUF5640 domain-containing protein [Ruminococcus sp.]MEE3493056.1 DUF5640 domain-containing protein [Ruminococcus sp.]